jgi:hypothetical protein
MLYPNVFILGTTTKILKTNCLDQGERIRWSRWKGGQTMCACAHLICLPTFLPADSKEQAGRTHHDHVHLLTYLQFSVIKCTNSLLFCGLWNFWSFGLLQSFFPTIFFLSPLDTTKVLWSGRSYASHGALEKATDTPQRPGPHLFTSSNSGNTWRAPKRTQKFSTKTLRESPPVLSMRSYTGKLGSGVGLISSVHWKSWISCGTHI